jgi:hypothetical protein
VGVTTTVFPIRAPGYQVYVDAPVLVSVAEPPEQTTVGLLTAVIVGFAFTLNNTVCVVIHEPLDPRTVYVVLVIGATDMDAVVAPPGAQVYDEAPVAVNVDENPRQIVVGLAVAIRVGVGVTETCIALV